MKAWLQLLRAPNVFTALADVAMGFLVVHGTLRPEWRFSLLALASCALYLGGTVLNDVYDAEVDARDRPERPIPSGRVARRSAAACGVALVASGVLVGWFASYIARDWRPAIVASLLAGCIVLYDGVLKRTPLAPLAMGLCRSLNVLLGMSIAVRSSSEPGIRALALQLDPPSASQWWPEHQSLIALGIGLYVVGVTVFARTEARTSARGRLVGGLTVLLAGIALLAAVPAITDDRPSLHVAPAGWFLLWAALALITARRCVVAVYDPAPQRVQAAVRHLVHSIIVLDAAVCVGYAGPLWGFAVLALLAPTLALTAWIKAT